MKIVQLPRELWMYILEIKNLNFKRYLKSKLRDYIKNLSCCNINAYTLSCRCLLYKQEEIQRERYEYFLKNFTNYDLNQRWCPSWNCEHQFCNVSTCNAYGYKMNEYCCYYKKDYHYNMYNGEKMMDQLSSMIKIR